MLKLLLAPHATPTLAVMAEAGILGTVLGGVPLLASFENTAKAEAAIGAAPDATRRLGALGVGVMEDAERLSQRLRLSNAEFERLMALEYWWRVRPAAGEHAARVLLYQLGPASFTDRVLVAWSRSDAGAADRDVARTRDLAATLDRTALSAQGGGFYKSRRAERAGNGRSATRCRTGLDRRGFSRRSRGHRRDRRSRRAANAGIYLAGFKICGRAASAAFVDFPRRLPASAARYGPSRGAGACARPAFRCPARQTRCRRAP